MERTPIKTALHALLVIETHRCYVDHSRSLSIQIPATSAAIGESKTAYFNYVNYFYTTIPLSLVRKASLLLFDDTDEF